MKSLWCIRTKYISKWQPRSRANGSPKAQSHRSNLPQDGKALLIAAMWLPQQENLSSQNHLGSTIKRLSSPSGISFKAFLLKRRFSLFWITPPGTRKLSGSYSQMHLRNIRTFGISLLWASYRPTLPTWTPLNSAGVLHAVRLHTTHISPTNWC